MGDQPAAAPPTGRARGRARGVPRTSEEARAGVRRPGNNYCWKLCNFIITRELILTSAERIMTTFSFLTDRPIQTVTSLEASF